MVFGGKKFLRAYALLIPFQLQNLSSSRNISGCIITADEKVNPLIYVSLLRQHGNRANFSEVKNLHSCIIRHGHGSDKLLNNLLIQMYGKCDALEEGKVVFKRMAAQNVFSWTIMINAYVKNGQAMESLCVFQQMQMEGFIPDKVTFVTILDACSAEQNLRKGREIHDQIIGIGFELDVYVGNAILSMYAKCGSVMDARKMFDKIPSKDQVSWNAMIAAYAQNGCGSEALDIYKKMRIESMAPDKITFISIIDACATCINFGEGKCIHAEAFTKTLEYDIFVGNAIVNMYAYAQCGHGYWKDALQLFQEMQGTGNSPSGVTWITVLDACAGQANLLGGKFLHSILVRSKLDLDIIVWAALVNMYGKCGNINDACLLFNLIPIHNIVSWNTMLAIFAQHGCCLEATELLYRMPLEGAMPNKVSFINVLSSCSHAGMLTASCHTLVSMSHYQHCLPTVEHYNCMVNLLGREGLLGEAIDLVYKMQPHPNDTSWTAVLNACRMYDDLKHGRHAAKCALEYTQTEDATYVLLSNIYASICRWGLVSEI